MKNVLVVDDEQDILDSLSHILKRAGYGVWTAPTGQEALSIAKKELPHLIILDLILPDMDGSDVAVELLRNLETRSLPIIFLTSMMRKDEQYAQGTLIANRRIIAKPCKADEILALVKEHIGPPA
jgi:two-component system alkaline phosphatase synthesis response regulator PhoP